MWGREEEEEKKVNGRKLRKKKRWGDKIRNLKEMDMITKII